MRHKKIFYILLVFKALCFAQNDEIFNITSIPKGATLDEIVKLAASVRPSDRQIEWQEQEFIFFMHFGINTFTDREWGLKQDDSRFFNPSLLDLDQWARTVKEAGGKTMIVLAKHHDGFCYWQTKYTDYSVKKSPWKNGKGDLIKEAAEACKRNGIKLGIYLSPWDIASPIYGTDEYNEHFRNQLRELLTNYGEVAEVWFDGACGEGPNGKKQVYDWNSYYKLIRELQPKAVIAVMGPDVRWVGTESGEGRMTEWSVLPLNETYLNEIAAASQKNDIGSAFIPKNMMDQDLGSREKLKDAEGLVWYPSEVDVSIRPGWFYHEKEDSLVKTPKQLFDIYFTSVGMNSVLLLNTPADKRGLIHEKDIESLKGMRKLIDETFKMNFLKNAKFLAKDGKSGSDPSAMIDNDNNTYWTTTTGVYKTSIEIEMPNSAKFDCLMLQEYYKNGQRVESFELEALIDDHWTKVCTGTTIGYKRLIRFPEVKANRVRLNILQARDCPAISTIGLYKTVNFDK